MAQVCLTADVHLGIPGRTQDIFWSLRTIRQYANTANIDIVIILGDLFHDRRYLEISLMNETYKFFKETKEKYGQTWIVFPGNHDMFLKHSWTINSLLPLQDNITVIEDIKILEIDDRRFWILPFISLEKSYMRMLNIIEKQHKDGDILLTHIGVANAILNTCFMLKEWSIVNFERSRFQRIYTGHFHSQQQIGENVYYPGSPIPFKFDEGDVIHGFYVLDTTTNKHRFVNIWKAGMHFFPDEIPPPQFCTITDDALENLEETDVKHNAIRIVLQREYTFDEKKTIRERIMNMGAKSVYWKNLISTNENVVELEPNATMYKNLFTALLEADPNGTKGLDLNLLTKINDDVIQTGDELYSLEEVE